MTTAILGVVLLAGAAICAIAGTVLVGLGILIEGLKGWMAFGFCLLIGEKLFSFGINGINEETERILEQRLEDR